MTKREEWMRGLRYKSRHDMSNQSPSPALAGNEVHDAIPSVYSTDEVALHVGSGGSSKAD